MPRFIKPEEEALEPDTTPEYMTEAEVQAAFAEINQRPENVGDLTDGGKFGIVDIYPTQEGKKVSRGRAVAYHAYMWNGSETVLPLAYTPGGRRHDGARHYLRKRKCLCCGDAGFEGLCKRCVRNGCTRCKSGHDKSKNIACFYLKIEDVPFPQNVYGDVDCFLPTCPRRGKFGFKTEQEMRIHATHRHSVQYQAHLQTEEAHKQSEVDRLQDQVNSLLRLVSRNSGGTRKARSSRRRADHPVETSANLKGGANEGVGEGE